MGQSLTGDAEWDKMGAVFVSCMRSQWNLFLHYVTTFDVCYGHYTLNVVSMRHAISNENTEY
jgi:hypothetical protein